MCIIELVGELDLDGAPRLEEALRAAEAGDAASIVVDLGQLEFIDSTGLRLLVLAADRGAPGRFSLLRGPSRSTVSSRSPTWSTGSRSLTDHL